ncbi:hypothetical protein RDV89_15050 [Nocardioides zeae]|uniref:Protein kinase domain-containing protein n=1 Tax=Nocardioides imazamoxiresistens TaxID=3231893 RepID=A0ABU3PYT3_9ACTN|nr:hypothetical protein [Nocardioides zeae]MDT9594400.1 hypothetical protein [Nocardioides zeae]
MLADGAEIEVARRGRARVVRLIGRGGQGVVHEVRTDDGETLALKWYHPHSATAEQYRDVRALVETGPPHPRFLWPIAIARSPERDGFGYVMPLRAPHYLELTHLLSGRGPDGEPLEVTFASTLVICRQLALAFLKLHAHGLVYRDISFGNVFFDPATGDTLVCDNDNVSVDDGGGRVLGTPFFMAPEVVADPAYATLPSTDTDRHSLAVLIFYTLMMGHPFEGERTGSGLRDQGWLTRHFGTDPVYCLDPSRDDNRPPELVRTYAGIYPRLLLDLCERAFVAGARAPLERVTEGEWVRAMDQLRDLLVACAGCGTTCFWDPDEPGRTCRTCDATVVPRMRLAVGRSRTVALSPLATLRTDHVADAALAAHDSDVVGRVVVHPEDPDRWGLRNVGDEPWTAVYAGDLERAVAPGGTVELQVGLRLRVARAHLLVKGPPRGR